MPSCATVDQVSQAHGLILGSGKPGLNQVWAVLNWEGVEFQVPRSAPAFVSLAQTSIWVNAIDKYCDMGQKMPVIWITLHYIHFDMLFNGIGWGLSSLCGQRFTL